ncbi:MAG: pyridoxal 5'-phosphate synthase glutaminase subunit PdxT [Fimbriimonadaceae bacterium]
MHVGVLAIQGDFVKHILACATIGARASEVRTVADLSAVDRLIIPGGESTTVGLLLERFGLGPAIIERADQGMPMWGTCMGMILMASQVEGHEQYSLGLLDITVRRNAFGAQVHSFEDEISTKIAVRPVTGVFIRAPIVTQLGDMAEAIACYNGNIVGVRQGNRLGTSFHPELTEDVQIHQWFVNL